MPDWTFPVLYDDARVSSGIGPRSAPVSGASTWHKGIDIAAPTGAPVVAPGALYIDFVGQKSGYGNAIYGIDSYGQQHRFAHLDGFNVRQGDTVGQGFQIGTVGATGNVSGSHLHYEVRDRAGNLLRNATETVIAKGKRLIQGEIGGAVDKLLKSNPVTAPFAMAADFLGVNPLGDGEGGCGINPICHLQKWFEETAFVERATLFIVATVLIIGGILFLAKGYNPIDAARKAIK